MIDVDAMVLSARAQCKLLGLAHSSLYYEAVATDEVSLHLMVLIDEEFTRHPFIGTRRMVIYLQELGHSVNRKRIQRLYHIMMIETIYQKKNLIELELEVLSFLIFFGIFEHRIIFSLLKVIA